MKQIAVSRPHYLTKLHQNLLDQIPALQPSMGADGKLTAVMSISGDGVELCLEVPDDADVAAIEAVIAAHDPTPPPPPPDPDEELALAIEGAKTFDDLKAALLGKLRPGRVAGRPTQ